MEEHTAKVISLPDMTVAFAALSTLFGKHAVLAKQDVEQAEYQRQFKQFLTALDVFRKEPLACRTFEELTVLLSPIFGHFYLNQILRGYLTSAADFLDNFESFISCYEPKFVTLLSGIKSEDQLRQSKEIDQFLSNRLRVNVSADALAALVKLLDENCLWLVYAAISAQIFFEQPTRHEIELTRNQEMSFQGTKIEENSKNGNNLANGHSDLLSEFQAVSAALKQSKTVIPPVRVLTVSESGRKSLPTAVSFSQSGEFFGAAFCQQFVTILPAVQFKETSYNCDRRDFQALQDPLNSLAFAANDTLLLGASGCEIIYWKLDVSEKSYSKYPTKINSPSSLCSAQPIWALAVSPLDLFFAAACHDSSSNLFDLSQINSRSCLVRAFIDLSVPPAPVTSVGFHSNCAYLANGHANGSIVMWDVNDAMAVRKFQMPSSCPVSALKFAPDGTKLVAIDDAGNVSTWDLRGTSLSSPLHNEATGIVRPARFLSISGDSSLICIGGTSKFLVFPMDQSIPRFKPVKLSAHSTVLDADFRMGNVLHVLTHKS